MVPQTAPIFVKRDVMLAARPAGKAHKKLFGSDDERSSTGSTTASCSEHDHSGSGSSDEDFAVATCQQTESVHRDPRSNSSSWFSLLLRCSRRAPVAEKKPVAQLQNGANSNMKVSAPKLATRVAIQPSTNAVNQPAARVVSQPPWRSRRSAEKEDARKYDMPWRTSAAVISPQRKAEEALRKAIERAQFAPNGETGLDRPSTQKKKPKHEGAALLAAAVSACNPGQSEATDLSANLKPAPGLLPPPGLSAPAGPASHQGLAAAPSVSFPPPGLAPPPAFDTVIFRRELTSILRDLAKDRRAASAVSRVRQQRVPDSKQAVEFADILTRGVEENRGGARQSILAFAAGLAAGRPSAFQREECAAGVGIFFAEIYEELLEEVPRLQTVCMMEMVPTLRSVFSAEELSPFLPAQFHA